MSSPQFGVIINWPAHSMGYLHLLPIAEPSFYFCTIKMMEK